MQQAKSQGVGDIEASTAVNILILGRCDEYIRHASSRDDREIQNIMRQNRMVYKIDIY